MTAAATPTRFGRVISSGIQRFSAECFKRECAPALGRLVAVEDAAAPIYGIVSAVETVGVDPSRRINSHGEPEHDLERVLHEHPHVPGLLVTTFDAVVVGYLDRERVRQYLPPAPAPILARVRDCDADETDRFMGSFDFLHLLLDSGPFAGEIIAAALRLAAASRADGRALLVRGGKVLAGLLPNDAILLSAILRRLQP